MSDSTNHGPEGHEFHILGQEREFGYGPITGEDNVDGLAYLAATMGLTSSDIRELTIVANEAGMSLTELLAILADVEALFAVIAAPILPPIAVIIDVMNNEATKIPPLISTDRHPFDELEAYRRRRRQQRFEQIRSENTMPSHMHRNVPGPFNTDFVNGMVRRSMLFGQLIALGNMTPNVDADPDAMRAANMVRSLTEGRRRAEQEFEPYIEGPDTPDPAS